MKKTFILFLIISILTSCQNEELENLKRENAELKRQLDSIETYKKQDSFIGEWVIAESSPGYGTRWKKNSTIKITKGEIFYTIELTGVEELERYQKLAKSATNPKLKELYEEMFKYQLNPESTKHLIGAGGNDIIFNEDSNTITTPYGWFKRKK